MCKHTPEVEDEIATRLSLGEPLRQICRSEGMPGWVTVYEWVKKDKDFAERIARARILGFDAIAEECFAIADDSSKDFVPAIGRDGEEDERLDAEHVQRSKLRIETRLKLLAKWDPKRYGDRIEQTQIHEVGDSLTKFLGDVRSGAGAGLSAGAGVSAITDAQHS